MNRIIFGDCRETMRQLAADGVKVQTCVTSPPYFGLRDYGHEGQIGLEETPEQYIAAMVEVFRCVRDLLADDGTLWLNIGDSYMPENRGENAKPRAAAGSWNATIQSNQPGADLPVKRDAIRAMKDAGIKRKDLIGIPWMLAFALRADGWYLRQDIIWHKPNPMPESVRDRCTKAHEYIFLLSKSERYFYDSEAAKEPGALSSVSRLSQSTLATQKGSDRVPGKTNGRMKAVGHLPGNKTHKGQSAYEAGDEKMRTKAGLVDYCSRVAADPSLMLMRNRRSVWTVTTKPYKGAHFATFPPDLIEPCILAGSRGNDIVLDPFMGSGTTAAVAIKHGRQYIGCELNPEYGALQQDRITKAEAVAAIEKANASQLDVFEEAGHGQASA